MANSSARWRSSGSAVGALGRQLVERFLRERQTLARLDHPYIARLLDGGSAANGEPYLVLEYVHGRHIDVYCREESLDVEARVRLFDRVLEAVAHAHSRDVVHRDLKPSNILICDDSTPRLLDFGIARVDAEGAAFSTLTGTGQRLFTPQFASPEQVRGERATELSDVFSLGVVLYVLLAGSGPWPRSESLHDLERHILDVDPAPPSQQLEGRERKAVEGDLDTIVLHCLNKEPSKRFASVLELQAELQRHLARRPILTRPTGWIERVVRHTRRNPWQVGAGLVLVLALATGVAALSTGRLASDREEALVDTLVGRLGRARDLVSQGDNERALGELYAVLDGLDDVDGQNELRVETFSVLSDTLLRTGDNAKAWEVVERGLGLLPADEAQLPEVRARLLMSTVECHRRLSTPEAASAAAQEAFDYAISHLDWGHPLRIEAAAGIATDRSIPLADRLLIVSDTIEEARERDKPHDGVVSNLLAMRTTMLLESGDPAAALEDIEAALEIDRWNYGEGHPDVAMVRFLRGVCLYQTGRHDEALGEIEEALVILEDSGSPDAVRQVRSFLDSVPDDVQR